MLNPLSVLPLHLACQILVSENSSTLVNLSLNEQIPKSAMDIPGGFTVFPDIGVAYKYHKYPLTWNAARRYCVAYGGTLAVIDSFEKIEHIKSIYNDSPNVHVGFHRLFDATEWVDIKNGLLATAIPWRSDSYEGETTRNCMAAVLKDDVGLFAVNCIEKYAFVCEVSIFKI